jgi:hypothetical protein
LIYPPPIRVEVLDKFSNKYDEDILKAFLWPPSGTLDELGTWDSKTRTFFSIYERRALEHGIKIPRHLIRKYKITNEKSMENAIREGKIALLEPTLIEIVPKGRFNKLLNPMSKSEIDIPNVNVLYRGTSSKYDQPLLPSLYREFRDRIDALKYDRLYRFTINIVIESFFDELDTYLTHNEAESIIQHYKILPWTNLIDLTYDINVAKAFASIAGTEKPESQPHLYQVTVWNLDLFDTGSKLIDHLPLARPKAQSAVAHFGMAWNTSRKNTFDAHSLIIALTEHPLIENDDNWKKFGGISFTIHDTYLKNPNLNDQDYNKLIKILYPKESDPRSQNMLNRIINTIEQNIDTFEELGNRKVIIQDGLKRAREESIVPC